MATKNKTIEVANATNWDKISSDVLPTAAMQKRYPDFVPFDPFVSKNLEVHKSSRGYGRALFATKDFKAGEVILEFDPHFKEKADQHTFRIGKDLHQTSLNEKAKENYLNHSCDPTAYIDFGGINKLKFVLRAARDIKAGEELTFNYFTTDEGRGPKEKKGEDDFKCKCDATEHLNNGNITGFRQLLENDPAAAEALRPRLSPYILSILDEGKQGKSKQLTELDTHIKKLNNKQT
jgi:SET domain